MLLALSIVGFALALLPCALFIANLREYRLLPTAAPEKVRSLLSVLIPARNEEANIEDAVRSVLASRMVEVEVIVLDDHSDDRTAKIVAGLAQADARVRLIQGAPLPAGWMGKNFACHQLAEHARGTLWVFLDADVRVTEPDALVRVAQFMEESGAALASGVPRQVTGSWLERLIIPLIHFVLLGFLPLRRMRAGTDPRFAAACGQLLAVQPEAYRQADGHGAVAGSIHDAVALTRVIRAARFRTDLFDATEGFRCRMYRRAGEVWSGFSKNAHEGLGAPGLIVPATLLLLGGQVMPLVTALAAWMRGNAESMAWSIAAIVCVFLPRLVATRRFAQRVTDALLHPLGILLLIAIQCHGAWRHRAGKPVAWKGRTQGSSAPPDSA